MRVEEILLKYQQNGVTFYLEGDKLRYTAPKGIMDVVAKDEVRQYKSEIMCYLEKNNAKVICDPQNKYLPFQLTDIQSAYLVGRNKSYQYGGVGCKIYSEFQYSDLDIERFKCAWKNVVENNDMLHAIINENGTQQILEVYSIPDIKVWQLNDLPEEKVRLNREDIRKRLTNRQYQPEEWPLYSIELSKAKDSVILHFSLDMLIADFFSINIIMEELEKYYNGEAVVQKKLSYRDIVNYNINSLKQPQYAEKRKNDEVYWKERISNMPEGPSMPVNNEIVSTSVYQLNTFIDQKRVEQLSKFARQNNFTLSTLILSIYVEVLKYWSEQKEFCVNITMANRDDLHPEINRIIGDFTVVDILEIKDVSKKKPVERMKALQEQLWEDLSHLTYTGVEVLREMTRVKKKDVIIPYVYTSTLGLQESRENDFGSKEHGKLVYKISQTPQVLIDCQVMEYGGGILVNWDIRENIFSLDIAENAFEIFEMLLQRTETEKFEQEDSLVELPEKMMRIREKVNNTNKSMEEISLVDKFCQNVREQPKKTAVIFDNKMYSYEELGNYTATIQNQLKICGCTEGKIVAVAMKKGIWQIASVLGILLNAGIYLPIDMEQPISRREKILNSSGAAGIILTSEENIEVQGVEKIVVDKLSVKIDYELKPSQIDNKQAAYIIYTSGSTGEPKGVIISHQAAMNTIQDIIERYDLTANDRVLSIANLAFDLSVFDIFGMLSVGGSIVLPKKDKNIEEWYRLIERYDVTVWNTVPAQMQMLVSYCEAEHIKDISKLKIVMLSGDWIPVNLPKKIAKIFEGALIVSLGGATEAGIWSIAYTIDITKEYEKSIPYGFPLSNQEFYVLDLDLKDCPDWVKGDLYIAGKGLAEGYLNDEVLTAKKFIYHPQLKKRLYRTGDCGRYLPNGMIEFLGREDFQVKIRGHRVELNEIDTTITNLPEIENAIVLTSEKNMDILGAFVQPIIEMGSIDDLHMDIKEVNELINENPNIFSVDVKDYKEWVEISNQTALNDIIKTFIEIGIFVDSSKWYTLDEIYYNIGVHSYYKPLIRRWLKALITENYIVEGNKENYRIISEVSKEDANRYWEKWKAVDNKVNYSPIMMQYFKESRENLIPLLQGKLDPVDLFFPKGEFTVALAAYKDNVVSKCMNEAIIKNIITIAEKVKKKNSKLRIMEIGAGVGGVSIELIAALDGYPVEYLFTDISRSFLNEAQEKFREYKWVDFALFDINKEYWKQNINSSTWDIILCNNVLHNANNELKVLEQFKEMAVPNGAIIILDATGTNYTLLTSMEFHNGLNGVEDFRNENEQVFLNTLQWEEQFKQVGIEILSKFPKPHSSLEILGQTLFVGKFSSKRKVVDIANIKKYLSEKLPNYMVPSYLQILKEYPLTANGKIDRKDLQQRIETDNPFVPLKGQEPTSALEKKVANIWKMALKRENIWKNENFYEAGGDSLLVAQVVAKMKEEIPEAKHWEWDKLMIALIDSPTIEGICKKLENGGEHRKKDENKSKSLMKINENQKNRKLVVLVHDGTGTKSPYDTLILHLKEKIDSLSIIVCNDMESYLEIETDKLITTLGEKYAHELLETGKEEFTLIGYCMGGLICLEIAKVLIETGKTVYPIISIDTTPSKKMINMELLMERAFGMVIGADILKAGHTTDDELLKEAIRELGKLQISNVPNSALVEFREDKFKPIVQCYEKLIEKTHSERLEELYETLAICGDEKILGYQKKRLDLLYRVFCHSFSAVINYDAGIYMGDALVLSCKDKNSAFLPVEETDNEDFWNNTVIGNVDMRTIDGNHLNCLTNPFAQKVANIILESMKL